MMNLKDDNYIIIQGWMRTRLNLTGNSLLVYAAIYGFSQDGVNEYTASVGWLADFVGITRRSVQNVLSDLLDSGLIVRTERNDKLGSTNGYRAVVPPEGGCEKISHPPIEDEGGRKNFHTGCEKFSQGVGKNFTPINNNKNNLEKEKESNNKKDLSSMTLDELQTSYDALCASVPQTPEGLDSILDECCLYAEEFARRFESGQVDVESKKPKAKKLPSYDEVIASYGFNPYVVRRMKEFIRACYASGQFVTNERLEMLCSKLIDVAELHSDEDAQSIAYRQINVINRAISGGYRDFFVR